MRKYINKLLLALVVVASVSCSEDFLDTTPTDSVSPVNALSSPENMIAALNGIHREMYAQSPLDDYSPGYAGESYILPLLELNAGDMLFSADGNGWFLNHIKWLRHTNPNSSDPSFVWKQYYHIIGSVNAIINAAEGMVVTPELNNALGQAYAYRAFCHHRLVSLYATNPAYGNPSTDLGVPIMLKTEAPYEGLERSTVEAVYTQCENDIKAAINYLKDASEANNKSHISLNVANGIAARIALTKGDYENAAIYAKAARNGFSLMSESDFKAGFNSVDNDEWIWGAEVIDDQTNWYMSQFYYIGTNNNGSQNRSNPKKINKNLYNLISDTDYRKEMWLEKAPNVHAGWEADPNYDNKDDFWAAWENVIKTYDMTTRFYTHPYMSVKFRNKDGGTINPDDILYMRAAEMYLIEAEALARQGGKDAEAVTVITELGTARDASYDINARGLSLIEEIKVQRRIELWGEGHRWLDLLRYDEALDLTDSGAEPTRYQKGFKQDKPSVSPNWLYQIPQDEMNANPKMKKNPTAVL
ncbi:MAG: RagB/SusD family nutrient uptake outer membrane protein [Marinifilaceae bacterium]